MSAVRETAKAFVGAAVAAAAAAVPSVASDGITGGEWWLILAAALAGGISVWATPNAKPAPDPRADLPQRRQTTLRRDMSDPQVELQDPGVPDKTIRERRIEGLRGEGDGPG